MIKNVNFPQSKNSNQQTDSIETEGIIVAVGPNGSGKTRLGSWIEFSSEYHEKVHRISAQKSLSMPRSISPVSIEKSRALLYYGYYDDDNTDWLNNPYGVKKSSRWGQNPDTFLLNDFDKLLTHLFSENYEEILKYRNLVWATKERIEPPTTMLDKLKSIWEYVLPHRELIIGSGSVETKIKNDGAHYNASEMSDGERVIFYLIGECLSAPENGIIIIDEPEMHLHRSIQRKLWDLLEKERRDCIFVYLTHDLDFASTRFGSNKVCINGYDGNQFDWYEISREADIPESVFLEVIGSRSPVLFVEGRDGSHDIQLYQYIYPDFTIKALGSCNQVIEAVKAFNSLSSLHHVQAFGIIDRDYKDGDHVKTYERHHVYSPPFAEVENLLLAEDILQQVAIQLCLVEPNKTVKEVKAWVFSEFERLKEKYALEAASHKINLILNGFDGSAKTIDHLDTNVDNIKANFDARKFYQESLGYAEKIIRKGEYREALKVFNHKGLLSQVGKFFGIKPNSYVQKVKNIITYGNREIVNILKSIMPELK
jgi:ABC-type lipoprotein export system ATPase subunit